MRKVKCSRAKGACFLEPVSSPQYGRGGFIPVNTDYVIPFRASKSKKMIGSGRKKHHKRKGKKNQVPTSLSGFGKKRRSKKKKGKRKK